MCDHGHPPGIPFVFLHVKNLFPSPILLAFLILSEESTVLVVSSWKGVSGSCCPLGFELEKHPYPLSRPWFTARLSDPVCAGEHSPWDFNRVLSVRDGDTLCWKHGPVLTNLTPRGSRHSQARVNQMCLPTMDYPRETESTVSFLSKILLF